MPLRTASAFLSLVLPAIAGGVPAAPVQSREHLLVRLVRDQGGVRVIESTRVGSGLPKNRAAGRPPAVGRLPGGVDDATLWGAAAREHAFIRGEFHDPGDPARIEAVRIRRRLPYPFTLRLSVAEAKRLGIAIPAPGHARQPTYQVDVLQEMGDPANRVDLVVLGDGYREEDQQKLSNDVAGFLETFWSYTAIGEYQNYFNVKLIHVISNQNGADGGSYGSERDTALGAYYGCYGIDRLICLDEDAVYQIAGSHAPEYDNLFVVVNDPKYGGSGGFISVFSVNDQYGPLGEVAMHEYGHSMGNLADEYEDPYPGYPGCPDDCPEPNVTTRTRREEIKWNPWIREETPLPTPETASYRDAVGIFEGARYQSTGVYRPRQNCLMRYFGYGFCQVCSEAMVLSFYNLVSPIDEVVPASPVQLTGCDQVELWVDYPVPQPDSMRFTWKLDGQVLASGSEPTYLLKSAALGDGTFQVGVEVSDGTALVRTDPDGLLTETAGWTVSVSAMGQGACLIDGECYPDLTVHPSNPCQICRIAGDPGDWSDDDGKACDDSDPCTAADVCEGGACRGTPVPNCCEEDRECDDGILCTRDECDPERHECLNHLSATSCLIDGVCHPNGATHPEDKCRICNAAESPRGWSEVKNCPAGCGCAATRLPAGATGGLLLLFWVAIRRRTAQ